MILRKIFQIAVVMMIISGISLADDVSDLETLAESDNPEARYELANYYSSKDHRDPKKALHYMEDAALLGHAMAQYRVSIMYISPSMMAVNYEKYMYWMEKAAEQGNTQAMLHVAATYKSGIYRDGQTFLPNYEKALFWFIKAAQQGESYAMRELEIGYKKGDWIDQDYRQAYFWHVVLMKSSINSVCVGSPGSMSCHEKPFIAPEEYKGHLKEDELIALKEEAELLHENTLMVNRRARQEKAGKVQ